MSGVRTRLVFVIAGILVVGFAVQGGAFRSAAATAAADPTACINALRADRDELFRISNEQTDNFNRWTVGSALDKADVASAKALREAATDFYKAFQYASKGQKTTANSWVSKGNAAIARSNAQVKLYNAAIDKINAATTQINADETAMSTQATATDTTCQGF